MKKIFCFLALCALLISCYNAAAEKNVSTDEKVDYETFKVAVKQHKPELKDKPDKEVSDYLFRLLNNDIYEYWKGTVWDFNGTSRQPQTGSIACGYFITNTLADLGFEIRRVKLAQMASSEMIKALCVDIHKFSDFQKLQEYLNKQPDNSVFIVGLDFHTGYILKNAEGSYFLHSNYINRAGVMKEKIDISNALRYNKIFVIGNLSANKTLLNKWVNP